MIRTALLLVRTSLVSVLFLAAALMTLATVMSDTPPDDADADAEPGLAAALVRSARPQGSARDAPAAARIALFDPERRPETVAGSIDDLRGLAAPPPPPVDVTILGVLLDGATRKAMLGLQGGAPAWSAVGAEVGGWRVASIDAEGAVLEHDGSSLALKVADRLKARARPHAGPAGEPNPAAPDAGGGPPDAPPADPLVPPDAVDPPKP